MNKPKKKKTRWQKTRKFFNDVHLWAGLISGLFVLIICFSGTVYVYSTEFTEMAALHLYKVKKPSDSAGRIAPDDLMDKVQKESGGNIVSVSIPESGQRTYQFNTRKEGDNSRFGTTYMVNPYNGEIAGNSNEETRTKRFMSTMFSLHRWFLLDKIENPVFSKMTNRELGSQISGWATILFTLGCITGLVIWFPQKIKTWRQGLKIKFNANWKRVNHDLHNTLAFYSLIFLLVMGLTGPQWSFPWYRTGLQKTLGTYKPEKENPKAEGEKKGVKEKRTEREEKNSTVGMVPHRMPLTIKEYLSSADKKLSYKGNYIISIPADSSISVNISKTRVGFFAPAAGDKLVLNQQTAAIEEVDIFREKPFNERIAGSIKALHIGNVYGGFSKLLYFMACLIATSLPVTGTLIWLNKLKKKKKRK